MAKENIIRQKSYQFALDILALVRKFPRTTEGFVVGNQLARAGTSVGANVEEANAAFSKSDFIYKMNTALKETRESNYWLKLVRDSELIKDDSLEKLINDSEEMRKILSSIVKSAQEKKNE